MIGFAPSLGWSRTGTGGSPVRVNVSTAGVHTLNLWMSEDGLVVDKIILTDDPGFVPIGTSSLASPRGDQQGPGIFSMPLKSAAASSTASSSFPISAATDFLPQTYWKSGTAATQWFSISLPAPVFIESVSLQIGPYPSGSFWLEISQDGNTWTRVLPYAYNAVANQSYQIPVGRAGSYLRVYSERPVSAGQPISIAGIVPFGHTLARVPLRVNSAANTHYVDTTGHLWTPDNYFNTGNTTVLSSTTPIANTPNPIIYRSERWDPSALPELAYRVGAANGAYTLKLHFAETYAPFFAVGKRIFDVKVENALVLDNLDVYKEATAGNRAVVKSIPVTITDGEFNLQFLHQKDNPSLRGFELIPN